MIITFSSSSGQHDEDSLMAGFLFFFIDAFDETRGMTRHHVEPE